MKQYKVFVQMANNRFCHDIISAVDDSPEKAREAQDKAISIANEILSRYKGEGVYCFVYIHDESFDIVYENDNISFVEEKEGDQLSLADIMQSPQSPHKCSCLLGSGFTKDENKKFIEYRTALRNDGSVNVLYAVYICDKGMTSTLKSKVYRNLDVALRWYNKL